MPSFVPVTDRRKVFLYHDEPPGTRRWLVDEQGEIGDEQWFEKSASAEGSTGSRPERAVGRLVLRVDLGDRKPRGLHASRSPSAPSRLLTARNSPATVREMGGSPLACARVGRCEPPRKASDDRPWDPA